MTAYVVDASVVIQRLIVDTYSSNSKVLFNSLADSQDELWVPEFCLLECANVLWKQVRFRGLPEEQALQLIRDLIVLPFYVTPVSDLISNAMRIGLDHELAIYDSLSIAMAAHLGHSLITVDAKQEKAAKNIGVTVKPITDFVPAP
ncbi:MAG: type II toxin-antitoxin system VapC family toxin [Anaerolineae bacterium]|nr:type II toxin-antitoxin system VapC family toxin [Anaerolineae bacterium]